jgi:hypothetical protein
MRHIFAFLLLITLALGSALAQNSFQRFNTPEIVTNLSVYPNPSTSGDFSVKFNVESQKMIQIKVYNLIGREVFRERISTNDGAYKGSFTLRNFPKGVYMLEVSDGNQRLTRRLSFI